MNERIKDENRPTPKMNFIGDGPDAKPEKYRCIDTYKIGILRCMGCTVVDREIRRIEKNGKPDVEVTVILHYPYKNEHDNILKFVNLIHSGKPRNLSRLAEYHREEMNFIRSARDNTRAQVRDVKND
jgi:hypothetical protein